MGSNTKVLPVMFSLIKMLNHMTSTWPCVLASRQPTAAVIQFGIVIGAYAGHMHAVRSIEHIRMKMRPICIVRIPEIL